MVSPIFATPSPPSRNVPIFTNVIEGWDVNGVDVLAGAVTFPPMGGVPVAKALLSTLPAFTSAAVNV